MRHLSDTELVDLVDEALPAARAGHVADCDACRDSAESLRAVLAQAGADPAPDPSPLFWDHFAARVSAAVREEPTIGAAVPRWKRWLVSPASTWAASAVVALMLLVAAWPTVHAPTTPAGVSAPAAANRRVAEPVDADDLDLDEAWAIVRTAADGLAWEDVHAEGISANPGSADRVALELTGTERLELMRLLDEAMKHHGA